MKPSLINHPLRMISISYHSDNDLSPFESEACAFHELLEEHRAKLEKYLAPPNELIKKNEELEASFSKFRKNYFSPIIQQWKAMEIDSVSLDTDMDQFCGELSTIDKLRDKAVKGWNSFNEKIIS